MKTTLLISTLVAAALQGAAAVQTATDTGTCPNGLRVLRTVAMPNIQANASAAEHARFLKNPYKLKFRVAEVDKVMLSLGPSLKKGYRYLLFDQDRKYGLAGAGCVVEGMVRCKTQKAASHPESSGPNTTASSSPCGTPCEQDFRQPGLPYARAVMSGALAAFASARGQGPAEYQPKAAAMIGVGAGTMAGSLLTAFPGMEVDAVDIEEGVVNAAIDCFGLNLVEGYATRLHKHIQDGVEFLRQQPKAKYDLMLFDVAPSPPHFAAIAGLVGGLLAPNGVVALNGWKTDTVFRGLVQNLSTVFPTVWSAKVGQGNEVSFAANGQVMDGFPAKLEGVAPDVAQMFREFKWSAEQKH